MNTRSLLLEPGSATQSEPQMMRGSSDGPSGRAGQGFLRRIWRGRREDPSWVRPTLLALVTSTLVLYLWDLGASGWANSFYSAAVFAGTKSWKAFFFGSFDPSNLITVDKPPASLWVMDLSARVFGLNSWSILVPQALMGAATVAVVYATVRRWFSAGAGLIAAAVVAVTPVAVLMFRFNNPDALLVLLLTLSAYATTRAIEAGSTRWLVLAGTLVGFGFLTKMLQAFLIVPALGLAYLIAAPGPIPRRIKQLTLAGIAMVVAGGWWVAVVEIWPAASRPYIGGSQNNSVLQLIFGYNGFGRLSGNETGSVTGGLGARGAAGGGMWGPTGWTRLFNDSFGGQVSWLLPAALAAGVLLLLLSAKAGRTDRTRAAVILWGGSLVVSGAAISLGQGIIHPYYTVALAPAIGALCGIGASQLWLRRYTAWARLTMAFLVAVTAVWSFVLLDRTPQWHPWIRYSILIAAAVAIGVFLLGPRTRRMGAAAAAVISLTAVLGGPAAFALSTAAAPESGAIPSAGPATANAFGFGPGPAGGAGGSFGRLGGAGHGFPAGGAFAPASGGSTSGGSTSGGSTSGGGASPFGGTGGFGGFGRFGVGGGSSGLATPGGGGIGSGLGRIRGAAGGLLEGSNPGRALVRLLDEDSSRYEWVAAAVGANQAAGYELAAREAVMALGGFNGSDPSPTLAQFEADVRQGKVHYFLGGGGPGASNGGSSDASEIASWVESHFTSKTVDGVAVYDLTSPN